MKFLVTVMVDTTNASDTVDSIAQHVVDHVLDECTVISNIEARSAEVLDDPIAALRQINCSTGRNERAIKLPRRGRTRQTDPTTGIEHYDEMEG